MRLVSRTGASPPLVVLAVLPPLLLLLVSLCTSPNAAVAVGSSASFASSSRLRDSVLASVLLTAGRANGTASPTSAPTSYFEGEVGSFASNPHAVLSCFNTTGSLTLQERRDYCGGVQQCSRFCDALPADATYLCGYSTVIFGELIYCYVFNVPVNNQDNDAVPGTSGGDFVHMGGPNAGAWAVAWLAVVAGGAML